MSIQHFMGFAFDSAAPIVHRCRCGLVVEQRGTICETCAEEDGAQIRAIVLAHARESVPNWAHADVTDPDFKSRVDPRIAMGLRAWDPAAQSLVLLGDTGKGKTTGAIAYARARFDRARTGPEVRFASGIRFASALELSRVRRDSKLGSEPAAIRTAKTASMLILDEVGGSGADPMHEIPLVVEVMHARYDAQLTTLVTSGLTEEQLRLRYGEATKRRMTERARVVACFGVGGGT